jgi:hypothetical protein
MDESPAKAGLFLLRSVLQRIALALLAAKGLADLKTREVAAQTLRRLAKHYGLMIAINAR